MPSPTTCCPRCNGTGKIELDPALADVYQLIGRKEKSTTAIYQELADKNIGQTAVSNRLARLRDLGHIELSSVIGRAKHWKRK